MNELIRAFQCINVFDPELEYDYEPLKTVLKQEWHDEASKALIVATLDELSRVGEIDDAELCSMLAQSYSEGISPHEQDDRLATIWNHFADGEFGKIYPLVNHDLETNPSIKECLVFDQMLAWVGDLRAMRTFVAECLYEGSLIACLGLDSGADEVIYYTTAAIPIARKLQSEEYRSGLSQDVVDSWFNDDYIAEYRSFEADAWFQRGRAYRAKWLTESPDDAPRFRPPALTSMRNAADLGHEAASYYFPGLLMGRWSTEQQLDEAALYAKDEVIRNPGEYIKKGNEFGKKTGDVDLGAKVVCFVAQCYAESLGSFEKDCDLAHRLFEVASQYGSEWADDALGHFKKRFLGGWEYRE